MVRIRKTAAAIATAGCMTAAFAATLAAPASALPASASAGSGWCTDGNGQIQPNTFWRCTSPDPAGLWKDLPCNPNTNYNGANGPWNVYVAGHNCGDRVWLHQYTNWVNNGWSFCVPPGTGERIATQYQHPENIYITSNPDPC